MPKFFQDPTVELQRLNENMWFRFNKKLLLGIANTKAGRDLLCIPQEYPRILGMKKNCVHWMNPDGSFGADFRIGAKFSNALRYRWDAFNAMARYYVNRDLFASPLTKYAMSVHADTLTAYPDPDAETTTVDGFARRHNVQEAYATIRSGAGTAAQDSDPLAWGVYQQSGSSSPNYTAIVRAIFLFDTSSLTSGATISDATFSPKPYANGVDQLTQDCCVVASMPGSNTAIASTDYPLASWGSTDFATRTAFSNFATNTYFDFALNASGLADVSKTGVTKLGMRASGDVDNINPGYPSSNKVSKNDINYADQTGTSSDPKLVVTYTVSSARARMALLGVA